MQNGAVIIGGMKFETPGVEAHSWHDHDMTFDLNHAPERDALIRWCILHWTASERTGEEGARQIHRTLEQRGLSVEFAITNEGTIWQFLDPAERRARHCSRVNPFSVGVEVSGVGWRKPGRSVMGQSSLREAYVAQVHGWKTTWLDYLPAQHRAMAALADALLEGFPSLSRRVELEPFDRRSDEYFDSLSGFCGHLHAAWLTKKNPKCDPGPRPLQKLATYLTLSE